MKSDDPLIALIAEENPAARGAPLTSEHRALAQRVRQRVLAADRSTGERDPKRDTASTARQALRRIGSAALVAVSVVVVVVVGAVVLIGHSRRTGRVTGQPATVPIPTVRQVRAAMESQPRIVSVTTGGHGEEWVRLVLDVPAKYQAFYGNPDDPAFGTDRGLPKGRLTLVALVEHGFEYRWTSPRGCYRRYKAFSLSGQTVFGGDLPVALSARSARTSAGVVSYQGQEGERIAVNRRTRLIQSVVAPGLPSGGVPATRTTYSYPTSVTQLPIPHLCP